MEFLKMRTNDTIEPPHFPARQLTRSMLIAVLLSGCGGAPPSMDTLPSDARPEQVVEALKLLQASMGSDEQTYAEFSLYAAEYTKLESERLQATGDTIAARDKLIEAGKRFDEARAIASVIENDRVLKFPEDRILGTISVRPWDFKAEYREFAPAQGAVRIDHGLMVQFSASREFDNEDLAYLATNMQPGAIQYLSLSDSHVDSNGLAQVANVRGVIDLSLYGLTLDDRAWESLSEMRSLRHLNLIGTNITSHVVKRMGIFPALEEFSAGDTSKEFTEEALLTIRQYPRLRSLVLRGGSMSDVAMSYVSSIHELERIWIGGKAVTRYGVELLRDLPHLREIVLLQTSATDEEIQALAATMPKVKIDSMGNS